MHWGRGFTSEFYSLILLCLQPPLNSAFFLLPANAFGDADLQVKLQLEHDQTPGTYGSSKAEL